MDGHSKITQEIDDAARVLAELSASDAAERVARVAESASGSLRGGGKIMVCGNGGSACDAAHFCEELTGRYRGERRALAAIACIEGGHLTCVGNDYGYDAVFSRWVEALGKPGDLLIAMSTSGNSRNVLRAVEAAGEIGMSRLALLGRGGGVMRGLCEHEVVVPGDTADRIQELHMLLLHTLVGAIERGLGLA